MLTITEIKNYIEQAKNIFIEKYPDIKVPKIVVCPVSRRQIIRNKVFQECGATKEDSYGTEGEVISGIYGKQIIVYQSMAKSKLNVYNTTWHELGHILFGDNYDFGIDLNKDTPIRSGYAIINEFMAQYIAFTVNDFKPFKCLRNAHIYLQMAFSDYIKPYYLSLFYSIIHGDKTLPQRYYNECAEYVQEKVWGYIDEINNELERQLSKPNFWKVSTVFFEKVGELYDAMYHIVYESNIMNKFREIISGE